MSQVRNQKLGAELRAMGWGVAMDGPLVHLTGRLQTVLEFSKAVQLGGLTYNDSDNASKTLYHIVSHSPEYRDDFKGGSYRDLMRNLSGEMDLAPFFSAREQFQKSGIEDKIRHALRDFMPKRKRRMSEHDGEWMLERKWELTPFSSTTKVAAPGRMVDLVCNFAISCGSTAEEVNRYGAMAWAINNIIEDCGVQTRLMLRYRVNDISRGGTTHMLADVDLKQPGEYLAPSLMAPCFHSLFWRRPIFGLICTAAELAHTRVNGCLGYPKQESFNIKFEDGALLLAPNVLQASSDELEAAILQAIRQQTPAA